MILWNKNELIDKLLSERIPSFRNFEKDVLPQWYLPLTKGISNIKKGIKVILLSIIDVTDEKESP